MSRLTERYFDGEVGVAECGNNCKYGFEYCEDCAERCPAFKEIYEKLAHYEDLEEQGRLIELQQGQWMPFKLDTRGYVEIIHYECSNCHNVRGGQTMYCPNCGAKMETTE